MLEFISCRKKLNTEYNKPTWLVVFCRREKYDNELGVVQAILSDTQVLVDLSATRITDEDEQCEFSFEVAQYLVEQKELIMGEDGDYYLPLK